MSLIVTNEADFQAAYSTPFSTITFEELKEGSDRNAVLKSVQIIDPDTPYLFLVDRIKSGRDIYLYHWAFDLDDIQIGSTKTSALSKSPTVLWADSAISRMTDYIYLWIIMPNNDPFSLDTDQGFRGVVPEVGEIVFFFSEDIKISAIDYDYSPGPSYDDWQGDLGRWQNIISTYQGDLVTW